MIDVCLFVDFRGGLGLLRKRSGCANLINWFIELGCSRCRCYAICTTGFFGFLVVRVDVFVSPVLPSGFLSNLYD